VANVPAAGTAVLAAMIRRLSPELTATSSMAEGNTQLTAWGPGPGEGRQHDTLAVANSCYLGDSPRQGWHRSGSHHKDPQRLIETPCYQNLSFTVC